jgi:hypothetical protein
MITLKNVTKIILFFFALSGIAKGQLREPMFSSRPADTDVVKLGELNVGFLPGVRVEIEAAPGSGAQGLTMSAEISSVVDSISSEHRGVLYNYSMQAYGLISGEVTFGVEPSFDVRALSWGGGKTPRALGPPGVFVFNASTGSEFVRIVKMLQGASAVLWVEISTQYINEAVE